MIMQSLRSQKSGTKRGSPQSSQTDEPDLTKVRRSPGKSPQKAHE